MAQRSGEAGRWGGPHRGPVTQVLRVAGLRPDRCGTAPPCRSGAVLVEHPASVVAAAVRGVLHVRVLPAD